MDNLVNQFDRKNYCSTNNYEQKKRKGAEMLSQYNDEVLSVLHPVDPKSPENIFDALCAKYIKDCGWFSWVKLIELISSPACALFFAQGRIMSFEALQSTISTLEREGLISQAGVCKHSYNPTKYRLLNI